MPRYKSGKLMMTAAYYKSSNNNNKSDNNDKSNNNEDKVCSLLKRWGWVDYMLDHVLDHMIIGLVTTALQNTNNNLFINSLHLAI